MHVSTHVLKTRNVHSAHVTSARSLSDDGSRREFNHLYFRAFKRFLLHSIDILLSPIGDLTNIHKTFLTALPERKNCLTSILVGVMESCKRTSFTPSNNVKTYAYPLFLKVTFNSKEILVYEDLLECGNVILLIEYQHSLFVVNRVNAPE